MLRKNHQHIDANKNFRVCVCVCYVNVYACRGCGGRVLDAKSIASFVQLVA